MIKWAYVSITMTGNDEKQKHCFVSSTSGYLLDLNLGYTLEAVITHLPHNSGLGRCKLNV